MNRKGKLTTKGKHAVILTLTIVACVAAMLFSLLLSVLCDGKHVSSAAHTQNDTHPGIMAGSQRQETDLLTPQWLYYQSNGSVTDCNIKKEMDVLMRKWTKGKLGGKELDRLIKEFLQKKDCPVRQITMQEKAVCVFPSEKELPDYTKTLAKREKIYQFIGVYTGGQQDKTEDYYVNTGRWQSVNGKKDKNCGVRDGRGIAGDISSVQTDGNLCWNIRKCIQLLSGVWK